MKFNPADMNFISASSFTASSIMHSCLDNITNNIPIRNFKPYSEKAGKHLWKSTCGALTVGKHLFGLFLF
jgi:hypothetical protein